jgi:hypothetical protein
MQEFDVRAGLVDLAAAGLVSQETGFDGWSLTKAGWVADAE